MKKSTIIIIVSALVVIIASIILGFALCQEKPEAKPPEVDVFASPLSGISPVDFSINVSVRAQNSPLRKFSLYFENKLIFERDISGDNSEQGDNFTLNITGGGIFLNLTLSYTATMTGAPAKIFSFVAKAEDSDGLLGEGRKDVIVFENKPCAVRVYIASPQGTPIGLPPFSVQIGAAVSDDRCGSFDHTLGTTCKFKFIWDADNKGGDFSPDGETEQPIFSFTYQKLGIYTPKVKVLDDGGNECESTNPVPVFVSRKIDNISVLEKFYESPQISAIEKGDKTKLFISKFRGGIIEYSVDLAGNFYLDSITKPSELLSFDTPTVATPKKTGFGDFLLVESPEKVFLYTISDKSIWSEPFTTPIERQFTKADIVSFSGKVTFITFFLSNFFSACFFIPEQNYFGNVCLNFELENNFSPPYSIFADDIGGKLYLAHYVENSQYTFDIYSFPLTFDNVNKIYVLQNPSHASANINFPPSKLSFFRNRGGKMYLVITTAEPLKSSAFRTYFFDVDSCISPSRGENCSPIEKSSGGNIQEIQKMDEFVSNIDSAEICAFGATESYKINLLDFIFSPYNLSTFPFCISGEDCIIALLCLDDLSRGKKCARNALYPFIFSADGKLLKNFKTNCIPFDYGGTNLGQKSIIHSRGSISIFDSGKYIFSADFSSKKFNLVDSESYFVEPYSLSGYDDFLNKKLVVSIGGAGGIDFLEFRREDGEFLRNSFHLYVRPYQKWADESYIVTQHYLDEDVVIALLQKPGCGESDNFSGLFVYDVKDEPSFKSRRYKVYKSFNDIGIHSVSQFAVKKVGSGRWNIVISGIRCQEVSSYIISFSLERIGSDSSGSNFILREISRFQIDESVESFFFVDDTRVVFSTPRNIYLFQIPDGVVLKKVEGEGGGKIFIYEGVIYEFISQGGYLNIRTFDLNLNKIRDFSFYIGIYPSISKVHLARVIDEFFGFGELDYAFVGLSSPEILSNVSALIVFDITEFVRRRGSIDILGATPGEFYIGARDLIFFRTSKNLIFVLDFSGNIMRVLLK